MPAARPALAAIVIACAFGVASCTPAPQAAPVPAAAPAPAPAAEPAVAAAPAGQTMTPPNAIEAACLAAVKQASGQARVVIISSDFAEDATTVVVGAGLPLVNWRCAVAGGAVASVTPEPGLPG